MANFDNIRLEKGMYSTGRSFTAALESLDPSENYKGTALEGLDAYQRQLKRFDIHVSGTGSDTVEKFFKTTDSATLFPEYVARAVRQGMDEADVLPRIIASTTVIDGMDYRSITSTPTEDEKELKEILEGTVIPETVVHTKENLVKLQKRGRMLVASYEAIRFQRLDLFTVTLKQIGAYIARSQLKDAINVLENGDGNNNAASSISVATAGTLTYADLIDFWNLFDPYELNTIVTTPSVMASMLNIGEFKDAIAGMNFQGTGKMITPLGADLIKSSSVTAGKIIGLDKSCALEMVKAGDVIVEYDKLIDRQLERAAITSIAGFAKIFSDASKVLSV
ncbi:MAG: phage major capsid protein [Clostridiales bacterium]|nr:phage major capsid protein [Clostridiales bacterium]